MVPCGRAVCHSYGRIEARASSTARRNAAAAAAVFPLRRGVLFSLSLPSLLSLLPIRPARAVAPLELHPSSPDELLRALAEAPDDAVTTIALGPGEWRLGSTLAERTPVKMIGASGSEGTTIVLDTEEHYVPALTVTSPDATIESLSVRHRSPSVANNYAVYIVQVAGDVTLRRLDVSSETGTGVAVEGGRGRVEIVDCLIHDTKNNGIGIFPALGDDGTPDRGLQILVSSTTVRDNGREAIVGRGLGEGVAVRVEGFKERIRGRVEFSNCEEADIDLI